MPWRQQIAGRLRPFCMQSAAAMPATCPVVAQVAITRVDEKLHGTY